MIQGIKIIYAACQITLTTLHVLENSETLQFMLGMVAQKVSYKELQCTSLEHDVYKISYILNMLTCMLTFQVCLLDPHQDVDSISVCTPEVLLQDAYQVHTISY